MMNKTPLKELDDWQLDVELDRAQRESLTRPIGTNPWHRANDRRGAVEDEINKRSIRKAKDLGARDE